MPQPSQGKPNPLTHGSIEVPPEIRSVFERISAEIAGLRNEIAMLKAKVSSADEALNGIQHKARHQHEEAKRLGTADGDTNRRINALANEQKATKQELQRVHVFQVYNQGDKIPSHGACEILGKAEGGEVYFVSIPTADSLSPGRVLFAGSAGLPAGGYGVAFSALDAPVSAAAGDGYVEFPVGEMLGTRAGAEFLVPGNAGFIALTPGPWMCQVRPDAQSNPVAVAVLTGDMDGETGNPLALLYQGVSGDVSINPLDENDNPTPIPIKIIDMLPEDLPENWDFPIAGTRLWAVKYKEDWEALLGLQVDPKEVDPAPELQITDVTSDTLKLHVRSKKLKLNYNSGFVSLAESEEEGDSGYGNWFDIDMSRLKGDTGIGEGTPGAKGDTGISGSDGDKGDTGTPGDKGDKGDTGTPGDKGDTGAGDTGTPGDKGDTGTPGDKGDKGDAGATGTAGNKGDTGNEGEQGIPAPPPMIINDVWHIPVWDEENQEFKYEDADTPANSPIPFIGENGNWWGWEWADGEWTPVDTGADATPKSSIIGENGNWHIAEYNPITQQWEYNDTGIPAEGKSIEYNWNGTSLGIRITGETEYDYSNLKGDTGVVGDTGSAGPTGPTGVSGEPGATGAKGDTGAQGSPGSKGDAGTSGEPGAKGDTGVQGAPGEQGANGEPGATGAKGDTGAQGVKGDDGEKGDPGANGEPGVDGKGFEFEWQGTTLKVRVEGEEDWLSSNLIGEPGRYGRAPEIGLNGNWWIEVWSEATQSFVWVDTERRASTGEPPKVINGNWHIQENYINPETGTAGWEWVDTNIPAYGYPPYIGENGNWYVAQQNVLTEEMEYVDTEVFAGVAWDSLPSATVDPEGVIGLDDEDKPQVCSAERLARWLFDLTENSPAVDLQPKLIIDNDGPDTKLGIMTKLIKLKWNPTTKKVELEADSTYGQTQVIDACLPVEE
jgi:hypothetical protein